MLINRRNLSKKCSEATFVITLLIGIFFVGRYSRNFITKLSTAGFVTEQGIPDNEGPNDPQTPGTTGDDQHEEVIRELQPVSWEYDRQFKNPCIRKSDSTLQCIPYFYMAGSVESGAKLLYRAIMQHPQAVFPGFEEANFFSKRDLADLEAGGIQDYFTKYANASDMILGHTNSKPDPEEYNNLITGDATPYMYLSWNRTHITNDKKPGFSILEYIHHIVPHAKIIVIFREPVERLFADYCKRTKWEKEHSTPSPRHFHERSCRAVSMYNNLYKRSTRSDHTYDRDLSDFGLLFGMHYYYWDELTRVFPRKQILLLHYKKLFETNTLKQVFAFLGMDNPGSNVWYRIKLLQTAGEGFGPCGDRKILWRTRSMLRGFYDPYNELMYDLTKDEEFLYPLNK